MKKPIPLLVLFFMLMACGDIYKDPYQKEIPTNIPNWEPRDFSCPGFPDFTLGFYSDPNKTELKTLCECLYRENQIENKEFILYEFGDAINKCIK